MVGLFYKAVPVLADEDKIGGSAIKHTAILLSFQIWPISSMSRKVIDCLECDNSGQSWDDSSTVYVRLYTLHLFIRVIHN